MTLRGSALLIRVGIMMAASVAHREHGPLGDALAQQTRAELSSGGIPSCVASQSEYDADDEVSRACDHSRDDAEINPKLRTQHRQDEEETNED